MLFLDSPSCNVSLNWCFWTVRLVLCRLIGVVFGQSVLLCVVDVLPLRLAGFTFAEFLTA